MKTPMTVLLAGAAFSLCAAASVALAADQSDQAAARQAQEDARSAQAEARDARDDARGPRTERREVRVYRQDGGPETRIYGDGDREVIIIRGGGREETLTSLLQLRPEQQPALKAFLEATRQDRDRAHDHLTRVERDGDGRTTLQRLDEMQAKAAEQRAEMDRKVAAIKTFYGQLDGKQRKAFDAMPMLMIVGPTVGPMMIPRPMPIGYHFERRDFAVPPIPPVPPVPPQPPLPPRS